MYYDYGKSLNKRLKFYQYQGIALFFLFLLLTLFNVSFTHNDIRDKNFTFLSYNKWFINFYYLFGLCILAYILHKVFYITKKNTDFLTLSDEDSRDTAIRQMINSLITRHLFFIWYFIITYLPLTLIMSVRVFANFDFFGRVFFNYVGMVLISVNNVYLFGVKLSDPFMREFVIGLFCFFQKKDKDESINESVMESVLSSERENGSLILNGVMSEEKAKKKLSENNQSLNTILIEMEDINKEECETLKNELAPKIESPVKSENVLGNFPAIMKKKSFTPLKEIPEVIPERTSTKKNTRKSEDTFMCDTKEENQFFYIKKQSTQHLPMVKKKTLHSSLQTDNLLGSSPLNTVNTEGNSETSEQENYSCFSESTKKDDKTQKTETQYRKCKKTETNRNYRNYYSNIQKTYNRIFLKKGIVDFDLMNYHILLDDNLIRMLAMSVAINDDRIYDKNFKYKKYFSSLLPWKEESFYTEKTNWKKYDINSLPEWSPAKRDSRFKNIKFSIKSFSPFVFHHLRMIDNISITDIIHSLDPIKNLTRANELKVSGGRGDNSISTSWDKKIIIKTISKSEKKLFKAKMLKDYHSRMRDTKSLLCRIYGLYKIELNDKGSIHVLLQKNMCDLPGETNLLTFDLKGSTVDRQCISSEDVKVLSHEKLMEKYKRKVLKDKDLGILNMKFNLNSTDGRNLLLCIENDSLFLEKYLVTDYSLLVFVHRYRREDICNDFGNLRIMQSSDNKYIFNFSIIDFLGTFTLEKKSEKLAKEFVSLIKKSNDTNFSVLDPVRYGFRFRNYTRSIVYFDEED